MTRAILLVGGLVMFGGVSCKGCVPSTDATLAWTPDVPECKDYHFKAQRSGEAVLLTISRPQDAVTVTYKSAAQNGTTFDLSGTDPKNEIVDAPPAATATTMDGKVCFSFGQGDTAKDPCLSSFVTSAQKQPWCKELTPVP